MLIAFGMIVGTVLVFSDERLVYKVLCVVLIGDLLHFFLLLSNMEKIFASWNSAGFLSNIVPTIVLFGLRLYLFRTHTWNSKQS